MVSSCAPDVELIISDAPEGGMFSSASVSCTVISSFVLEGEMIPISASEGCLFSFAVPEGGMTASSVLDGGLPWGREGRGGIGSHARGMQGSALPPAA